MRVLRLDIEMAHRNLRACPRQSRFALEHVRVVILVGEAQRIFARAGDGGRKGQAHGLIRLDAHALAERKNRIEHRADRVREWAVFRHGGGRGSVMAAPEKTRAVGFILHRADRFTLDRNRMDAPHRRVSLPNAGGGAR